MSRPSVARLHRTTRSTDLAQLTPESALGDATVKNAPRIEPLWSPDDVATYLGIPVKTLYQWRWRGEGPAARKVGRHLRYEPAEVRQWFANLEPEVA